MNIIVRRCMKMLDLVEIRRQYFDPQAKQDLPVSKTGTHFVNEIN